MILNEKLICPGGKKGGLILRGIFIDLLLNSGVIAIKWNSPLLASFHTVCQRGECLGLAGALTGTHRSRDSLVLPSVAKQPEIQYLASRGQTVTADPPLLTDGQTHNYNFNSVVDGEEPEYSLINKWRLGIW